MAFKLRSKSKVGSSITSKFQKRNQETLEKVWKDRENQPSGNGGSKSIFNQELLQELGLTLFKPDMKKEAPYYLEILPCSFDPTVPYFAEITMHEMVGINNDQIVCMKTQFGKDCYRCNKQKELWQKKGSDLPKKEKSVLVSMYPRTKVIYLVWNRTEEIVKEGEKNFEISVWNPPKAAVHLEIQNKVRNKRTKQILDISELGGPDTDSEGRTVYFEIGIKSVVEDGVKKTFPQYGGWDLLEREEPIPEEITEKLDEIVTKLEEIMNDINSEKRGYKLTNPLEALVDWPEEGKMEKLMSTEVYDEEEDEKQPSGKKTTDKKPAKEEPEEEIPDIDSLAEELENMSKIKMIRFAKEKGLEDLINVKMDKEEIAEAILVYYQELMEG